VSNILLFALNRKMPYFPNCRSLQWHIQAHLHNPYGALQQQIDAMLCLRNAWTCGASTSFVLSKLCFSGPAMFHPFFFWFFHLFGNGQFMRFLHPLAGVALVLLFYSYAVKVWNDNHWRQADNDRVKNMLKL
jgi:hypothetical protein